MDNAQLTALQSYIRQCADLLGLTDWEVELRPEPPDDPIAGACVEWTDAKRYAHIKLPTDFLSFTQDKQREYIVHELIHLHFANAEDVIRLDLFECRELSRNLYTMLWLSFKRQMEYGVDQMARVVALSLPHPMIQEEEVTR